MQITFEAKIPPDPLGGPDLLTLMQGILKRSQEQARPRGGLTKKFPRSELWTTTKAWPDNRYDLLASDGVQTLSRVWCAITAPTNGPVIPNGSTVVVYYTENGTPWIQALSPIFQKPGENNQDSLDPIVLTAGLWLNTGGYWWTGYSYTGQIRPMDTVVSTETITGAGLDWNSGTNVLRVTVSAPAAAQLEFDTVTLIDGIPNSLDFVADDGTNRILGYNGVTSSPTEVEVTYTYALVDVVTLGSGNSSHNGPMSLRGIVMFPGAENDQMAAVLTQTYSAGDVIMNPSFTAYTEYSPGVPVFAIPLRDVPLLEDQYIDYNNTRVDFFEGNPDFPDGVSYILANDSLYVLAYWPEGVLFSYQADAGNDQNYVDGFNVGFNTIYVDWDGSTTIYNLTGHPDGQSWISYVLIDCYNTSTNDPVPFTQSGNEITIDPTGLPSGQSIAFYVSYEWGDNLSIRVYFPVREINQVNTAAGTDEEATFEGRTITLGYDKSQELKDFLGSYIEFDYVGYDVSYHAIDAAFSGVSYSVSEDFIPDSVEVDYNIHPRGFPEGWPIKVFKDLVSGDGENGADHIVYFGLQVPEDSLYLASYTYMANQGNRLNFATATIREFNVTTPSGILNLSFDISGDATPIKQFLPMYGSPVGPGDFWNSGWETHRWGYLAYNPNRACFNVVGPDGLHWQRRSGGANSHTFLAWPTEALSQDPTYAGGWSYPGDTEQIPPRWGAGTGTAVIPDLKRRTAPHLGVGIFSRYALMGSWGPVTNEQVFKLRPRDWGGGGGGNAADTAFPIYGFRQDPKTNAWKLIKSLSPLELVSENAGVHPIYMPGAGMIHAEGRNGWSYGHGPGLGQSANPKNSWWPASRDSKSWIVGAGWCEAEWGQNFRPLLFGAPADFAQFPRGHHDSGFTLNAINTLDLQITSQLTIKTDPLYEEGIFSNDDDYRFYSQEEVDNSATRFATTTFDLHETRAAETYWGFFPGYGLRFFFYVLNSLDLPDGRKPLLRYPGIPNLASCPPRYANLDENSDFLSIGPEDAFQSQELSLADNGDLYVALSMPYWLRYDDQTILRLSKEVTGTWVSPDVPLDVTPYVALVTGPSSEGRYVSFLGNSRGFYLSGWEGGNIISGVTGPAQVTFSDYGGTSLTFLPWAGFFSPFVDVANHVGAFFPIENDLTNPIEGTDYNDIDYIIGYSGKPNTLLSLSIPWRQTVPDLDYVGFVLSHDRNEPGITYTAFTLGSGASLGPWEGVIMFGVQGLQRQRYQVNARTFLFRITCENGILTEKWRLDISYKKQIGPGFSPSSWGGTPPVTRTDNSSFHRVYHTRAKGRVIFVPRVKPISAFGVKTVMQIWDNTNPDVEPTVLHELELFDGEPETLEMIQDIDPDGLEWAQLTTRFFPNFFTEQTIKVMVRLKSNLTDTPTVKVVTRNNNEIADNVLPRNYNFQGMAQAQNTYVWTDNNAAVYRRNT